MTSSTPPDPKPEAPTKPKDEEPVDDNDTPTIVEINDNDEKRGKLIRRNNMTRGIVIEGTGPRPSNVDLIKLPKKLQCAVKDDSSIEKLTVETSEESTFTSSGWTKASLSVTAPYIGATVKYDHNTEETVTHKTETIYSNASYKFPQGYVGFDLPTYPANESVDTAIELTDEFKQAITNALKPSNDHDKRIQLEKVFRKFGHVFQTQFLLGAELKCSTSKVVTSEQTMKDVKDDVEATLDATVGKWGASGSAGHGEERKNEQTKSHGTITVESKAVGGDPTKLGNTDEWKKSTYPYGRWRVMRVDQVVPVTEMLEPTVRDQVKMLMAPLLGRWVPSEYYGWVYGPKGDIPSGWCWVGQSMDTKQALLVKELFPKAADFPDRTPALSAMKYTDAKLLDEGNDEWFCKVVADYQGYRPLSHMVGFEAPPQIGIKTIKDSDKRLTTWHAVRQDLLLQGTLEEPGEPEDSSQNLVLCSVVPPKLDSGKDAGLNLQSAIFGRVKEGGVQDVIDAFVIRNDAIVFEK